MKNFKKLFTHLKKPKILRILIVVVILIIIVSGFFYFQKTKDRVLIENSVISAPIISISPVTAGTLNKLYVHEGEVVKIGDPIADVGDQTIRANSDGLIIKAQNVAGAVISIQNPVVSIIKIPDLRVDGTVDENKGLEKIKIGQPILFTVDAFPGKTYAGFIDEISGTAKQTQIAFSISSERPVQQFEVYAKFDISKYPEIKNGMSAKMTVFTK